MATQNKYGEWTIRGICMPTNLVTLSASEKKLCKGSSSTKNGLITVKAMRILGEMDPKKCNTLCENERLRREARDKKVKTKKRKNPISEEKKKRKKLKPVERKHEDIQGFNCFHCNDTKIVKGIGNAGKRITIPCPSCHFHGVGYV